MARICLHESIVVKNGNRIPSDGTKGKVFVIEDGVSHETMFSLCADWVQWKHLKVYPRDVKLGLGTFEVVGGVEVISLDRSYNNGWPDVYTLENLREDLEFRAVKLRLAA